MDSMDSMESMDSHMGHIFAKLDTLWSSNLMVVPLNPHGAYIWPITRILRVMALFTCDITRKHAITRPYF
jgi:hypothetical protein